MRLLKLLAGVGRGSAITEPPPLSLGGTLNPYPEFATRSDLGPQTDNWPVELGKLPSHKIRPSLPFLVSSGYPAAQKNTG